MPRKVRALILQAPGEFEIKDDEVVRVVKAEYVVSKNYAPQYTSVPAFGTITSTPTYAITGEYGHWEILVLCGPAEDVDEMAKAMERVLRSAP